jgi:hypothetical protein
LADKREIRHDIWMLSRVKTWQLVVILILFAFITATFLRLNNIGMVERLNAVISSDETGNIEETTSRLYDLQRYTAAHMNADTGQFDLTGQYQRDYEAAVASASRVSGQIGTVTARADAICKPRFSRNQHIAYVQCMRDELNKFGSAENLQNEVKLPEAALYRHSFASPLWSPDFAGWSSLICITIMLIILLRLITLVILRLMLNSRYKSV